MQNISKILVESPLAKLLQPDRFVGWVYAIDYEFAYVMTNDLWKYQAQGIPHNCFLVAASFDREQLATVNQNEMEVILLRVLGSSKLPQDDDLVRTKIDHFKGQKSVLGTSDRSLDDITRNEMQFGGLKCRVLGTFFMDEELWLGSDLESFATATRLNVYRPHGEALSLIINYVDPIRRKATREMEERLGFIQAINPFRIGTLRYTSTDRLHRRSKDAEKVPFFVQPADFLARRTAVLGMTRTGKSNMIKQLVSVVKRIADESQAKIGQIIYDINGEYANANDQDQGALADIYPDDTVRYRMLDTPGFRQLHTNFYEQFNEGFSIIKRELEEANRTTSDYVNAFTNMSLEKPDPQDRSEHNRWQVRLAAYKTLLFLAGFTPPQGTKVYFQANQGVLDAVNGKASPPLPDPSQGLTLPQAQEWFLAARQANEKSALTSTSDQNKPWVDPPLKTLLDMMAQRQSGSFISGYKLLSNATKYHSPKRTQEVAEEIYELLRQGKIVILDLSVGDAQVREKVSTRVAQKIFQKSMEVFVNGETPPNIVVYIEEAHNLIGKTSDLTDTWPRLAKEGAKIRISLVYATQEVSSMHPNILANTENWFITHLNNAREIKELAQFYDFDDFSTSLIRAQDVGFARVKMLSSPFVVPVQIDRFDPEAERQRVASLKARK